MSIVTSLEQPEALYGRPAETATVEEVDYITPEYRALIDVSPCAVPATVGAEGVDCSPRVGGESHDRVWPDRARNSI